MQGTVTHTSGFIAGLCTVFICGLAYELGIGGRMVWLGSILGMGYLVGLKNVDGSRDLLVAMANFSKKWLKIQYESLQTKKERTTSRPNLQAPRMSQSEPARLTCSQ